MDKNEEQAACNGEQQDDPVDNMDEESAAKEKLTSDPNKVKFTSVNLDGYDGKNGEAKVDIHVTQIIVGMGKAELMKYANQPFWIRLRMFLFVFFWISWIAMLVGAIVIILLAPRCPPAPKLDWYQKTAMYQVDLETFKDSDSDGIGDIKGLISKLDYFKQQNVGTLMLSAFYQSSGPEAITEHKQVDSKFGTINDFDELLQHMKEKDIKLIIDFNPNHSSDDHQWFIDSVEGKEPYKDFYVWADSPVDKTVPPDNWLNINGESAWTWNEDRQQFYLGTFGANKPDLNLRNENVRAELRDILRFWLEKGVDGFKVIAASHLIEDEALRDEPFGVAKSSDASVTHEYKDINHIFTMDQPENFDLFAEWRGILNNFTESTGAKKIFLAEVSGSLNYSMLYYGNDTYTLVELPIHTHWTEIHNKLTGFELKHHLEIFSHSVPENAWPTFLVGSKKTNRLATRVGDSLVDAMHMVSFIAKGTPITYYADELSVTDISPQETETISQPQTVMLWSNETNAGFSNGTTSLPLHPDYPLINVEMQEMEKESHLKIFRRLLALRGQPALSFGMQEYPVVTNNTFSMIRVRKGSPGYLVVVNLGDNSTTVDFTGKSSYLPEMGRVEIRSKNLMTGPLVEGDHPKIPLNNVPLDSEQAVVFSFVPLFEG